MTDTNPRRRFADPCVALAAVALLAFGTMAHANETVDEAWTYLLGLAVPEALGLESMTCGNAYGGSIVDCGVGTLPFEEVTARLEDYLDARGVSQDVREHDSTDPPYVVRWPAPNGELEVRVESLDEGTSVFVIVEFEFFEGVIDWCEGTSDTDAIDALRWVEPTGGGWTYERIRDCYDFESVGADGRTPLVEAIERGYRQAPLFLVRDGFGLDGRDARGRTPLMMAIERHDARLVLDLIDVGVDPHARDDDGWTGLAYAATYQDAEAVDRLLRVGAVVDTRDIDGWTPLMLAVGNGGSSRVTTRLLEAGSSVDLRSEDGYSVLMIAAANDAETATLHALLRAGADIDDRDDEGMTPLMLAAQLAESSTTVRVLLQEGADHADRDRDGWTATMHAARFTSQPGILAVLLSQGGSLFDRSEFSTAAELVAMNDSLLEAPALTAVLLDALPDILADEEALPFVRVDTDPGRSPYIEPPEVVTSLQIEHIIMDGDVSLEMTSGFGDTVEESRATLRFAGSMRTVTFPVTGDSGSYVVAYEVVEDVTVMGTEGLERGSDLIDRLGFDDVGDVTVVRLQEDGSVEELAFSGSAGNDLGPSMLFGAGDVESIGGSESEGHGTTLGTGGRDAIFLRFDDVGLSLEQRDVTEIEHVDGRAFRASTTTATRARFIDVDGWGDTFDIDLVVRGDLHVESDGASRWVGRMEGVLHVAFAGSDEPATIAVNLDGSASASSFVVASGVPGGPVPREVVEKVNVVLLEAWR